MQHEYVMPVTGPASARCSSFLSRAWTLAALNAATCRARPGAASPQGKRREGAEVPDSGIRREWGADLPRRSHQRGRPGPYALGGGGEDTAPALNERRRSGGVRVECAPEGAGTVRPMIPSVGVPIPPV